MKRLLLLLVVGLIVTFSSPAFADDDFVIIREKAGPGERHQPLIATGFIGPSSDGVNTIPFEVLEATVTQPIEIHKIFVTATAATSSLGIYDAATAGTCTNANCKFEIYEATDGAGYYIDFGDDPVVLTTAFSVLINDAYAVIHYRGQKTN